MYIKGYIFLCVGVEYLTFDIFKNPLKPIFSLGSILIKICVECI